MTNKSSLKGVAPKSVFKARNGLGRTADPDQAIFPIIKHDNDRTISLIGTGFFIAESGLFVTAKHVLMDVLDNKGNQTHPIALVQFRDGTYFIRTIRRCTSHETADIAVGIPDQMSHNKTKQPLKNKLLKLTPTIAARGTTVFTYAYPRTTIKRVEKLELHFQADYFEGYVQDDYPDGRDKVLLPGSCFQTSMHIHGGASGGPVFDNRGMVCGVNSTGYENDDLSFVTPVHTIENLLLSGVNTPTNDSGQTRLRELIDYGFVSYTA